MRKFLGGFWNFLLAALFICCHSHEHSAGLKHRALRRAGTFPWLPLHHLMISCLLFVLCVRRDPVNLTFMVLSQGRFLCLLGSGCVPVGPARGAWSQVPVLGLLWPLWSVGQWDWRCFPKTGGRQAQLLFSDCCLYHPRPRVLPSPAGHLQGMFAPLVCRVLRAGAAHSTPGSGAAL